MRAKYVVACAFFLLRCGLFRREIWSTFLQEESSDIGQGLLSLPWKTRLSCTIHERHERTSCKHETSVAQTAVFVVCSGVWRPHTSKYDRNSLSPAPPLCIAAAGILTRLFGCSSPCWRSPATPCTSGISGCSVWLDRADGDGWRASIACAPCTAEIVVDGGGLWLWLDCRSARQ